MHKYLCLAAFLALQGCIAVGPNYRAPEAGNLQDGYVYGDEPVYVTDAEEGAKPWWEAYSDLRIGQAVALAQAQNRDLRAAYYRLEAAEAQAGAARRALLPQGGTGFSVTRQQQAQAAFAGFSQGQPGQEPPAPRDNPEFTTYQAVGQASWEVDLFGRLRRQAQSASARADQQGALLIDTQRLVTARTVDTFILLVEAMNRRAVARRNLALQEETLKLVEQLYEFGEVPQLDVLRQRTQVNSTAAQVKQIESAAAQATAALALLCGQTVPEFLATFPGLVGEETVPEMPTAAEVIVLTEPAEVLRRRPDVLAAERQLASQVYDIGVETAALFPSVTLNGQASLTALDFSGLGEDQALGYQIGPRLSWDILSYPALLKQRVAAKAEAEAALATYEQTVLAALTEADEALALYSGAVIQAELLAAAEADARRSLELAELRYREGADSLIALLDAQRTALSVEDQAVQAKALALRSRAAVHRVLAD